MSEHWTKTLIQQFNLNEFILFFSLFVVCRVIIHTLAQSRYTWEISMNFSTFLDYILHLKHIEHSWNIFDVRSTVKCNATFLAYHYEWIHNWKKYAIFYVHQLDICWNYLICSIVHILFIWDDLLGFHRIVQRLFFFEIIRKVHKTNKFPCDVFPFDSTLTISW